MRNTIEEIKEECRKNIEHCKFAISAWEKVERVSKKDGSDFACFKKNFNNARVEQPYSLYELVVYYTWNGGNRDTITLDENDTVDDAFRKINEKISYLKSNIERSEKKLVHADEFFGEISRAMKQFIALSADCGFNKYDIAEYVKDNIYYF